MARERSFSGDEQVYIVHDGLLPSDDPQACTDTSSSQNVLYSGTQVVDCHHLWSIPSRKLHERRNTVESCPSWMEPKNSLFVINETMLGRLYRQNVLSSSQTWKWSYKNKKVIWRTEDNSTKRFIQLCKKVPRIEVRPRNTYPQQRGATSKWVKETKKLIEGLSSSTKIIRRGAVKVLSQIKHPPVIPSSRHANNKETTVTKPLKPMFMILGALQHPWRRVQQNGELETTFVMAMRNYKDRRLPWPQTTLNNTIYRRTGHRSKLKFHQTIVHTSWITNTHSTTWIPKKQKRRK